MICIVFSSTPRCNQQLTLQRLNSILTSASRPLTSRGTEWPILIKIWTTSTSSFKTIAPSPATIHYQDLHRKLHWRRVSVGDRARTAPAWSTLQLVTLVNVSKVSKGRSVRRSSTVTRLWQGALKTCYRRSVKRLKILFQTPSSSSPASASSLLWPRPSWPSQLNERSRILAEYTSGVIEYIWIK